MLTRGGASVFDNITKDDLIVAFFPCIYFSFASECRALRSMNAKAQEEIATLKENQRWRKCSEELPEKGVEVFVTNGIDRGISEWRGDHWNDDPFCGYTVCDIIAWMPMPKAPEVDNESNKV